MGTKDCNAPAMTAEDRKIVEECRASGMSRRFEGVVREMSGDRAPKDMDAYFEVFVSKLQNITVARPVLERWRRRFAYNIKFYRAFGVVMIRVPGSVCHIMPARTLHSELDHSGKFGVSPKPQVDSSSRLFNSALQGQRNSRLIT